MQPRGRLEAPGFSRTHAPEHVPVISLAVVDLANKQVPFRIDGEAMGVEKLARIDLTGAFAHLAWTVCQPGGARECLGADR